MSKYMSMSTAKVAITGTVYIVVNLTLDDNDSNIILYLRNHIIHEIIVVVIIAGG